MLEVAVQPGTVWRRKADGRTFKVMYTIGRQARIRYRTMPMVWTYVDLDRFEYAYELVERAHA
jgi:hypothetical protein